MKLERIFFSIEQKGAQSVKCDMIKCLSNLRKFSIFKLIQTLKINNKIIDVNKKPKDEKLEC